MYEWTKKMGGNKNDDAQFSHRNNNLQRFFAVFVLFPSQHFLPPLLLPSFLPLFFAQVKSIISRTIKAKKGRKNHRVRIRDFRQGSGNPTVVRRHFFFLFSKTRKKKRSLTGFPHCFKGRKGNISFIFAETKKGFS